MYRVFSNAIFLFLLGEGRGRACILNDSYMVMTCYDAYGGKMYSDLVDSQDFAYASARVESHRMDCGFFETSCGVWRQAELEELKPTLKKTAEDTVHQPCCFDRLKCDMQ